ncbi:MAG: ATPase [Pelagibacterium sp. SCN 63-23]|nr:MAG: ATPase [Pelagibacterium sp. SCN 63-23]
MARTDIASRLIEATPETIYAAMTDADALVQWLPPGDMSGEMLEFDPAPGGHYRMKLRYRSRAIAGKSGDGADIVLVRYLDLVPGALVSQAVDFVADDPAFVGTMAMHWILEARPEGTLVTIRAENVPPGIAAEDHEAGLAASLDNLARFTQI